MLGLKREYYAYVSVWDMPSILCCTKTPSGCALRIWCTGKTEEIDASFLNFKSVSANVYVEGLGVVRSYPTKTCFNMQFLCNTEALQNCVTYAMPG